MEVHHQLFREVVLHEIKERDEAIRRQLCRLESWKIEYSVSVVDLDQVSGRNYSVCQCKLQLVTEDVDVSVVRQVMAAKTCYSNHCRIVTEITNNSSIKQSYGFL